MYQKYSNLYLRITGLALVVVGLIKVYSTIVQPELLSGKDSIFMVTRYAVVWTIAIIEILCGIALWTLHSQNVRLSLVLWLSLSFIAYRMGLKMVGGVMCPCLGFLLNTPKISLLLDIMLGFFLLGSTTFLYLLNFEEEKEESTLKMEPQAGPTNS